MQDIKSLAEAAEELGRLTDRPWSQSEVLHYCSQKLIPLLAKVSIQEEDIEAVRGRQSKSAMWRNTIWQDAYGHWKAYVPIKPEAAWSLRQDAVTKIKHPADGARTWPVREVLVNLEQVRVDSSTIQKIMIAFQQPIAAPAKSASSPATPAPAGEPAPLTKLTLFEPAPAQTDPPAPVVAAKAEPVDEGWIMKKAALIKKHGHQWPTATRDFQDAIENGLSKAAKAPGHGEWIEAAALNWAEQRGKLEKEKQQGPANLAAVWAGTKHTTEG